jgi:hypothetical protein
MARSVPTVADRSGEAVAASLVAGLRSAPTAIVELEQAGDTLLLRFVNGEHWAIECIGPDAFHFYPGVAGANGISWANVWMVPDLTLGELNERLDEVATSARSKNRSA